jgi:hypothetical protein
MSETNTWYQDIERKITSLKDTLPKKDYQSYELDYLKRVAKDAKPVIRMY